MVDDQSYSDVVRGTKKTINDKENNEEVNSEAEMVVTDNKSWRSQDSMDTLTEISQVSMQTKIILEIQETLKQMKEEQ